MVAEWSDIRIKGNQIIQDDKFKEKGFTGQLRGVMPLNPPVPPQFTIGLRLRHSLSGD